MTARGHTHPAFGMNLTFQKKKKKIKKKIKIFNYFSVDERPYKCDLCGRAFSESGALTRHLKARYVGVPSLNQEP